MNVDPVASPAEPVPTATVADLRFSVHCNTGDRLKPEKTIRHPRAQVGRRRIRWARDKNGRWVKLGEWAGLPASYSEWAQVNWERMDKLYDLIPNASLPFNLGDLYSTRKYQKYNGKLGSWKEFMHNRGIGARHNVSDEAKLTDGHWRPMGSLVGYATPWKQYAWWEVKREYSDKPDPFKQYIHHLIQRYEGEVAIAWQSWEHSHYLLPRDAGLWDQQFVSNQ